MCICCRCSMWRRHFLLASAAILLVTMAANVDATNHPTNTGIPLSAAASHFSLGGSGSSSPSPSPSPSRARPASPPPSPPRTRPATPEPRPTTITSQPKARPTPQPVIRRKPTPRPTKTQRRPTPRPVVKRPRPTIKQVVSGPIRAAPIRRTKPVGSVPVVMEVVKERPIKKIVRPVVETKPVIKKVVRPVVEAQPVIKKVVRPMVETQPLSYPSGPSRHTHEHAYEATSPQVVMEPEDPYASPYIEDWNAVDDDEPMEVAPTSSYAASPSQHSQQTTSYGASSPQLVVDEEDLYASPYSNAMEAERETISSNYGGSTTQSYGGSTQSYGGSSSSFEQHSHESAYGGNSYSTASSPQIVMEEEDPYAMTYSSATSEYDDGY